MKKLHTYRSKREPKETPEPMGGKSLASKFPLFVVQKHAASHLHYDLRLEAGGVMKSWAVPKGPSLNPQDKRLAMMVEDHPLDYRTFEGTIPPGNYGAGTVMVWDEGTYAIEDINTRKKIEQQLLEGLEKGHVDFTLQGNKLNGTFSLIKIKQQRSSKENSWLLVKKRDNFASEKDVSQLDHSVQTNRTMEEIAEGKKVLKKTALSQKKNKNQKLPLIKPMLATLVDGPFDNKDWIFEIKWDGYRAIAQLNAGRVFLYSRNQKSFNEDFPPIVEALKYLKIETAILDGEVVVLDDFGKPNFQLMQNYQRTKQGNLFYYVFDLLFLDGQDLREFPLIERKQLLQTLILSNQNTVIRFSDHVEKNGIAFFKEISKQNLEGLIGKYGQSHYQMKRSKEWVKIKTHLRQEAVIGGFTQPRGSRKKFGALLLGVYDKEGKLHYIGHVGTGFNVKLLTDIYNQLEPLQQTKSPFAEAPKANMSVTWVKPNLVCEVEFTEWTSESRMRHPTFKGLRTDKKAKKVEREFLQNVKNVIQRQSHGKVVGKTARTRN